MDDERWEGPLDEIMSKPRNGPNGIHGEVSADLRDVLCRWLSGSSFSCVKHITLLHMPTSVALGMTKDNCHPKFPGDRIKLVLQMGQIQP